jgi:hypothetical protein
VLRLFPWRNFSQQSALRTADLRSDPGKKEKTRREKKKTRNETRRTTRTALFFFPRACDLLKRLVVQVLRGVAFIYRLRSAVRTGGIRYFGFRKSARRLGKFDFFTVVVVELRFLKNGNGCLLGRVKTRGAGAAAFQPSRGHGSRSV